MAADGAQRRDFGANAFKLGLFGMNCSGGLSLTKAPERWDASWENNLAAAKMADEVGLEFLLPIGRWHGYRGETDTQGTTFETLTWACGLLAATQRIRAFGTVHVAFINPVFAAKQMITADHIGRGRFGLNIVSGWNPTEFGMFGVELKDHDDRYGYAEEWIHIVKRIWSETEPFDHDGKYFSLRGVLGKPKPFGGGRPILVSAGNSEMGRAFAARNVDCLFTAIPKLDGIPEKLGVFRSFTPEGQSREAFASAHLMCRATRKEAEDYHHYIVYEQGDWEAAEYAANYRGKRPNSWMRDEKDIKARLISGAGYPIIGSYDDAVETMKKLKAIGIDGLACGMINYVRDMPAIRDELIPRMERAGLREKRREAA